MPFAAKQGFIGRPSPITSILWTPENLTGVTAWYDVSDTATITESGGSVSQLNDKSGNNYNLVQATASLQPITATNSYGDSLHFDGVDDNMVNTTVSGKFSGSGPIFMFSVFDVDALATYHMVASVTTGPDNVFLNYNPPNNAMTSGYSNGADVIDVFGPGPTVNVPMIAAGLFRGSTTNGSYIAVNGNTPTTGTMNNITVNDERFIMGARWKSSIGFENYMTGNIYTTLYMNTEPSAADRQRLEGWAAHKWGITDSLPAGHPYKNAQPTTLWTPMDLTSATVAAWHDASDATTITLNGSTVSQWDDKSGNGNHATQATAAYQPVYNSGNNSVDFQGIDDRMDADGLTSTVTGNNKFMVFQVVKYDADDFGHTWGVDAGSSAGWEWAKPLPTTSGTTPGHFSVSRRQSGENMTTGVDIQEGSIDYRSTTISVGGIIAYQYGYNDTGLGTYGVYNGNWLADTVTLTTEDVVTRYGFVLGALRRASSYQNLFTGKIYQSVVISGMVSEEERQKLEGWGAHKHGMQSLLPAEHPYKSAPPTV